MYNELIDRILNIYLYIFIYIYIYICKTLLDKTSIIQNLNY